MTWKNETTRQPLPAPLPMYEPVRLKHVPTIVRRRYDRNLKTFKYPNKGLPSEEGKNDGDEVEDNDDPSILSDVGDSVDDNEVEDDYQANFDTEHDIQSNMEDYFGSSHIESSSSTYGGDSKIENNKDEDTIDTSSYVDSIVEDNTKDQSWQSNANSDMNDHGSYSKEDCEDEDEESKEVDFRSSADVHDNEEGSNSIDEKNEVDGPEDVSPLDYADASVKNEVEDDEQGVYVSFREQDNRIDDDRTKDGFIASRYDNGSVEDGVQDDSEHGYNLDKEQQGFPEEDEKSERDKAEGVTHYAAAGPNFDDSVECAEDTNDTNEDTSVNSEAQHKEQRVCVGFHEQENNINDDGINGGIIADRYENSSDQDKVEDDEHGNFDKEQASLEEDDKSEGNRVEDVIHDIAGLNSDNSVDNEVEEDAKAKFDTKHDTKSYTTTENSDTNNLEETIFEGEIQQRDCASSGQARVEDSIKNDGHESSNINQQDEEDGANNVANIKTSVNHNTEDLSDHHNEKCLYMGDCRTIDGGRMNAHATESKDNEKGNFDDEQDLLLSDCKKIEDGTIANDIVDKSFKLQEIIIEKQHEDLDNKQGVYQAQCSSFAPTPWLARRLIQVQWDPSPLNFRKLINFNGLSTSSPKVGIIIRDAHGAIISAQVYKMGAISPFVAEAWALRNGLLQANKLGRTNRCTEGDTRLHIRMSSRDYQCPWNLQFLVEDSKHLH